MTSSAPPTSTALPNLVTNFATPTPHILPTQTSLTTSFEEIQRELKKVLDLVEKGQTLNGLDILSRITDAVVTNCEQLGLTTDDHPYTPIDREGFWAGINNCWLYALSRTQTNTSEEQQITDAHLYSLRQSVIAWANVLEKFGLVDYEMGWWETDILEVIDNELAAHFHQQAPSMGLGDPNALNGINMASVNGSGLLGMDLAMDTDVDLSQFTSGLEGLPLPSNVDYSLPVDPKLTGNSKVTTKTEQA
ncbi:hypothetical protein BZG36_00858 [Bifiguratus adelaidae]|uniref:Uncharacterized protein n=1 Tax=Bifiguratus adelaidae TaxID=1938954 RepID=A0A261Y5C0_9FUNG|nr:hypothetical protein BZG36_00858 [Bifiguratus adelaidae]